jgi:hypothetical protein
MAAHAVPVARLGAALWQGDDLVVGTTRFGLTLPKFCGLNRRPWELNFTSQTVGI